MKTEEKGLTVCSFIFALIAVIIIAIPFFASPLLYLINGLNDIMVKLGNVRFKLVFGIFFMAFGFTSWIASMLLLVFNMIYNREGMKTRLGRVASTFNTVCFIYYVSIIYLLFMLSKISKN